MIIWINENQEVISVASGLVADEMTVDQKTSFRTEQVPTVAAGERLCFDPVKESFYTQKYEAKDSEALRAMRKRMLAVREANKQREEILQWFAENDWKVNKRALGEWAEDDERWVSYLAERQARREAYDRAIDLIGSDG